VKFFVGKKENSYKNLNPQLEEKPAKTMAKEDLCRG